MMIMIVRHDTIIIFNLYYQFFYCYGIKHNKINNNKKLESLPDTLLAEGLQAIAISAHIP